jgi:hypothetical protein
VQPFFGGMAASGSASLPDRIRRKALWQISYCYAPPAPMKCGFFRRKAAFSVAASVNIDRKSALAQKKEQPNSKQQNANRYPKMAVGCNSIERRSSHRICPPGAAKGYLRTVPLNDKYEERINVSVNVLDVEPALGVRQ